MISVSQDFINAMAASNRFWKIKAEVIRNDAGALPVDISDRVLGCTITPDYEQRTSSCMLTVNNFDYALSPLNQDSTMNQRAGVYDPLFDSNHKLIISYGLLTTAGYEYIKKFTGYLGDDIDSESYPGVVQLSARDSKLFQDAYIFQSKTYGTGGSRLGMTLENVMQDMINDFLPGLGITISVPAPTNQTVGTPQQPYTAKDTNLWAALQLLADAFNHELRFLEDGTLILRKEQFDYDAITPVDAFDESEMVSEGASLSDSDVRNHVVLRIQGLDPIEKKNEDSIAKYGRRYFEIRRAVANVITTQEQAHEFVNKILKDLSYANPVERIECPLYPQIQVGDFVTVSSTRQGTDPQLHIFRVTKITDTYGANKKRTALQLEGFQRVDFTTLPAPNPPTGLDVQSISRDLLNYSGSGWSGSQKTVYFPLLKWTAPTQDVSGNPLIDDFGGYTIYRNTGSGWHVLASIKSYSPSLGKKLDYFYDYTLGFGQASYRIVAVNRTGQVSTESASVNFNCPPPHIISGPLFSTNPVINI